MGEKDGKFNGKIIEGSYENDLSKTGQRYIYRKKFVFKCSVSWHAKEVYWIMV